MPAGVEALLWCPSVFLEEHSGQSASLPPPPLLPDQEMSLTGHCEVSRRAPGRQGLRGLTEPYSLWPQASEETPPAGEGVPHVQTGGS